MTRKVGDNADPQLTDLFEANSWFRSYHLRRTTRNDERTRELDDNEELLGLKAIKKLTMVPTSCLCLNSTSITQRPVSDLFQGSSCGEFLVPCPPTS